MTDVDKRQIFPGTAMHTSGCLLVPFWVSYVRSCGLFTPDIGAHHSYVRTPREDTLPTEERFSYVRSIATTTASSIILPQTTSSKSRHGSALPNSISKNFAYLAHNELISKFSYVRNAHLSHFLHGQLISYVRKSDFHAVPCLTRSSYVRNHIDVSTSTCISYVRTAATSVVSHNGEPSYVRKLIKQLTYRSPHQCPLFAKKTSALQACNMGMPPPGPRKVRHRHRLIRIQLPRPPRHPRGFLLSDQKLHFARLGLPGSDGRSHFGDAK